MAKPHGLAGEVIVALVTNRPERLAPGSVLTTAAGELTVQSSSPHQGRWIVRFSGISGRTAAEALRGTVLSAPALDDPDELWVHELVGAEVADVDGRSYGQIIELEANPASDLLVLEGGGLVPLRFVVSHDRAANRIVIDPPEGLLP